MKFLVVGNLLLLSLILFQIILIYFLIRKNNKVNASLNHLQTNEEKYRDLFENANDAIFILDANQNYIEVNQRATDIFGFSREEFLQMNVKDNIPADQIPKSNEEFLTLFKKGKYEKFIGRQKTKDGRWLDIEVSSSLIVKNGRIAGSRDIVRDITERTEIEKDREALISQLQQAIHEIKTLKEILPLCSFCNQVRDKDGNWRNIDEFIHLNFNASVSHTVCPICMKENYPQFSD